MCLFPLVLYCIIYNTNDDNNNDDGDDQSDSKLLAPQAQAGPAATHAPLWHGDWNGLGWESNGTRGFGFFEADVLDGRAVTFWIGRMLRRFWVGQRGDGTGFAMEENDVAWGFEARRKRGR